MSIEQAPPEVQLAVDIIYLLESNDIEAETVLAALEIVRLDYQKKHQLKQQKQNADKE